MTEKEFLELGRGTQSYVVATEVLGKTFKPLDRHPGVLVAEGSGTHIYITNSPGTYSMHNRGYDYTTSWAAMQEVVESIKGKRDRFIWHVNLGVFSNTCVVDIEQAWSCDGEYYESFTASHESLPLALCIAALKAKEIIE